jgi:inhibitor of cysteine peptidase
MRTITILTKTDNGSTVDTVPHGTIAVQLPENPTTGYRWKPDPADEKIVQLKSATYLAGGDPASVGEGGTRLFEFEAQAKGEAALRFKLMREWEGDASAIDRFEIRVVVR